MALSIESMLAMGSRKEVGRVDEVVVLVLNDNDLLDELVEVCRGTPGETQMRAFDALEKVVRKQRDLGERAKRIFLAGLEHEWWEIRLQSVRGVGLCKWVDGGEIASRIGPLWEDEAKFVRAWAVDTAVELALQDSNLTEWAAEGVRRALESGVPSIVARAKKSAKRLG